MKQCTPCGGAPVRPEYVPMMHTEHAVASAETRHTGHEPVSDICAYYRSALLHFSRHNNISIFFVGFTLSFPSTNFMGPEPALWCLSFAIRVRRGVDASGIETDHLKTKCGLAKMERTSRFGVRPGDAGRALGRNRA